MIDLFNEIVVQIISEDTYPAVLAGLSWKLSSTSIGITLEVVGFSDKLGVLLETIIQKMANFDCNDRIFVDVKKSLADAYHDEIIEPYYLNKALRLSIICAKSCNTYERSAALEKIEKKTLKDYLSKYYKQNYIETIIQGNFTEEEAVNLMKKVGQLIHLDGQMPAIEEPKLASTELPVGTAVCRVLSLSSQTNKNSSITDYYQLSPANIRLHCLLSVLTSVMDEPCFNILRTKEGLGYYVSASDYDTYGIAGFGVSINSSGNDFDCTHIDNRIENFIKYMNEWINKDLTEDKFKEHVNSLITAKKVPDLQLSEEFFRNWYEIINFEYCFDRLEKEIKCLEMITFDEFKSWSNQQILNNQKKRKLSIQV